MRLKLLCLALLLILFVIPAMAAEVSEQTLEDRTEVIVTFPQKFPPQCFLDEKGEPAGFAIEVMTEVARLANIKVTYQPAENFTEAINSLLEGSADIIPNSGITPERLQNSDFTIPVETFEVVIFVREANHDISGLDDLTGRKVAVLPLNVGRKIVEARKEIKGVIYNEISAALFDLLAGKVDAFIYPKPVVLLLAREARIDERIKIVGEPLLEIKRALRVRKGDRLLNRLNPAVETLLQSKEYKKIYTKWYGKPIPFWTPQKVFVVMGGTLALLFTIMLIWRYKSLAIINLELEQNIVHRKKIARELQDANEELKKLDKMKSMFIASMSHELRTPLNSIIGFSEILLQGMSGELNQQQESQLRRISKAGSLLLSIVSDVIDISRIESGCMHSENTTFKLCDIVKDAIGLAKDASTNQHIIFHQDCQSENLVLTTDSQRLTQSLLNLLTNAVKFTEQGTITVSCQKVDEYAKLSVKDSGIGIDQDNIAKIFTPFERLESHLQVKAGGTGLGLYLVKKLVEDVLLGEIEVTSEIGRGSTFTITIPLVKAVEIKQSKVAAEA